MKRRGKGEREEKGEMERKRETPTGSAWGARHGRARAGALGVRACTISPPSATHTLTPLLACRFPPPPLPPATPETHLQLEHPPPRERKREMETQIERESDREKDKEKQTERERGGERERKRERNKERAGER